MPKRKYSNRQKKKAIKECLAGNNESVKDVANRNKINHSVLSRHLYEIKNRAKYNKIDPLE